MYLLIMLCIWKSWFIQFLLWKYLPNTIKSLSLRSEKTALNRMSARFKKKILLHARQSKYIHFSIQLFVILISCALLEEPLYLSEWLSQSVTHLGSLSFSTRNSALLRGPFFSLFHRAAAFACNRKAFWAHKWIWQAYGQTIEGWTDGQWL